MSSMLVLMGDHGMGYLENICPELNSQGYLKCVLTSAP